MSALLIREFLVTAGLAAVLFQQPVPAPRLPSPPGSPQPVTSHRGPSPPPLPETPIPPELIRQLVSDLNSQSYSGRRRATQELKRGGKDVVEVLADAARNGDLEVTIRTIEILEVIYASADERGSVAAEQALDRLEQSENRSAAARATAVLAEYYYEIREPRLVAKIRDRGGIVKYSSTFIDFGRRNPEVSRPQIGHIMLGSQWKWDKNNIDLLKKLKNLQQLYVGQGKEDRSFSEAMQREIQEAHPRLIIHRRGRAYLGISATADPQGRGIFVSRVELNTGASRAGIQVEDIILRFNGKPVPKFDELIEQIKQTQPGDTVKAELLRSGRRLTVDIVMGELGVELRPKK